MRGYMLDAASSHMSWCCI